MAVDCPAKCPAEAMIKVAKQVAAENGAVYEEPKSVDQTLGFIAVLERSLAGLREEYGCDGHIEKTNGEPVCRLYNLATQTSNLVAGPTNQSIEEFNYQALAEDNGED